MKTTTKTKEVTPLKVVPMSSEDCIHLGREGRDDMVNGFRKIIAGMDGFIQCWREEKGHERGALKEYAQEIDIEYGYAKKLNMIRQDPKVQYTELSFDVMLALLNAPDDLKEGIIERAASGEKITRDTVKQEKENYNNPFDGVFDTPTSNPVTSNAIIATPQSGDMDVVPLRQMYEPSSQDVSDARYSQVALLAGFLNGEATRLHGINTLVELEKLRVMPDEAAAVVVRIIKDSASTPEKAKEELQQLAEYIKFLNKLNKELTLNINKELNS